MDALVFFSFTKIVSKARMVETMSGLRKLGISLMPDVTKTLDYLLLSVDKLFFANVLKYRLIDGFWLAIHSFGTEPKMKVYYLSDRPKTEKNKSSTD